MKQPLHLSTGPEGFTLRAFTKEGIVALATKQDRLAMLERVRGGEAIELEIEARTFIQRDTPNRNFVRFKKGRLRSIAKSGAGTPFLKDHQQGSLDARGGVVTASRAVKNAAGETEFLQTITLTEEWAVLGVLTGKIDRFSIGFIPKGPVTFRHNGKEIGDGFPEHFPGDELEDGTLVEWVFADAELIESSAVNVPAVTGTGIGSVSELESQISFRAALAAHFGGFSPQTKTEEKREMKELMTRLGLTADASEASALAAIEKIEQAVDGLQKGKDAAELELKAEREAHERTSEKLSVFEEAADAAEETALDTKIEALYASGKLVRKNGKDDEMEETLRELDDDARERVVARMSGVPQGRQSSEKNKGQSDHASGLTKRELETCKTWGITPEAYVKHNKAHFEGGAA